MIPYDLDKLQRLARDRCIARGILPTCLAIYHLVPVIRQEEIRAGCDPRETPMDVELTVDCVEPPN